MEEIEVLHFLNIIETEGCIPSHQIETDGRRIQYFLSWEQSTVVAINITDDTMTARTAADLLRKLELEDLIERLGLKIN
jgi:hypothetical protein